MAKAKKAAEECGNCDCGRPMPAKSMYGDRGLHCHFMPTPVIKEAQQWCAQWRPKRAEAKAAKAEVPKDEEVAMPAAAAQAAPADDDGFFS